MYNIVFYFYNKKRQPPFSYMTMKKKTTTTYLMKSILIIFPIFLPQATTGLQKENDGLNIVYHEGYLNSIFSNIVSSVYNVKKHIFIINSGQPMIKLCNKVPVFIH